MLFSANAVSKAKGQLHAQTRARQDATQERKLREQVRVLLPICLPVCLSAYLSACLPAGLLWKTGDGSAGRTDLCVPLCVCVPLCAIYSHLYINGYKPFIYENASLYQDRLGRNIGKPLKKRMPFSHLCDARDEGSACSNGRCSFFSRYACPEPVLVKLLGF
jgi:hypothetical protein